VTYASQAQSLVPFESVYYLEARIVKHVRHE
jgi:hypothetical protein